MLVTRTHGRCSVPDGHRRLAGGRCGALHRCYRRRVDVGLRELRQNASELVRRVEQGESITVTVSGRPAARLVPVAPKSWRDAVDLDVLYRGGTADLTWADDRARLDGELQDPFHA